MIQVKTKNVFFSKIVNSENCVNHTTWGITIFKEIGKQINPASNFVDE